VRPSIDGPQHTNATAHYVKSDPGDLSFTAKLGTIGVFDYARSLSQHSRSDLGKRGGVGGHWDQVIFSFTPWRRKTSAATSATERGWQALSEALIHKACLKYLR
jgi:hypothetical protein